MESLNFAKRNSTAPLGSNLNGFKPRSTNKGPTFSEPLGSLTQLPPELLLRIIDELDDAALCELGCTCRDFNSLIFPMLFDKLHITHYLPEGWISCFRPPRYTLRGIRCSLPTRKFNNIYYYFNKGPDHLVEEIEDMHAIVTRMDELGEFLVYLWDPDDWAEREAPGLDETQLPQLTSEEWTKLYLGLLTAAMAKGCMNALLGGGERFLNYLQSREQTTATHSALTGTVLPLGERVLGSKTMRYFDGAFRYKSLFAGQPKRHLQVAQCVESLPVEKNTVPQAEVPEGKSDKPPVVKERKRQLRLLKWVEFFSTKNKNSHPAETAVSSNAGYDSNNSRAPSHGSNRAEPKNPNNDRSQSKTFAPSSTRVPPKPKLQSLTLLSHIFLTSPPFLDWTNQVLSWCASTLTHLELECPKAPSGIWCKFLSKLELPSLVSFKIASGLFIKQANVQGSDILGFLSRHPGIQKIYFHGIQVSACLSTTPDSRKSILPNLTEVTAHPIWITWLLRNKKQCPKLKEITLLTECHNYIYNTFEYDAMDRALGKILPRSHNLDLIGFRFTCDRDDLDSWLQSHVDAGSNSIMSSFIHTKHLRIDSAYHVRIINPTNRLDLVAQVAGLFPNLDYLELKHQPDAYKNTDHIPPVIEALRRHSPQVKQVKINEQDPLDIADFQSSETQE